LEIGCKWEGEIKGNPQTTYKGNIRIPYVSDENDDDDFEVSVTVDGTSNNHDLVKDGVRTKVIPFLKEKIPQMLQELRGVASGKTKLPPKKQVSIKLDAPDVLLQTQPKSQTPKTPPQPKGYESFTITEKFLCRPRDLFECLVETNRVKAYAGGDAIVSQEKGGKFRLFGGSVEGENVEVESPKKLVQKWRFNTWPEGHYSIVTITLEEKDSKTVLKLTQTGVPIEDKERTEKGWPANFWTRIKGIFGYGSML